MSQDIIEKIDGSLATIASKATEHDEAIKKLVEDYASLRAENEGLVKRLNAMPDLSRISQPSIGWDEDRKTRFAKWVLDVARQKAALQEDTDAEGGYLVPNEFVPEILRLTGEAAQLLPRCRRFPMGRDKVDIPTELTSVSITWPGEEGNAGESEPTFSTVQLVATKALCLVKASNELLADSPVNITDYLMTLYTEALATELDTQIVNGSGTVFTGVLQNTSVNNVVMGTGDTSFAAVNADYLSDVKAQVKPQARKNAVWVMHRSVLHLIRTVKDAAGRYVFSPSTAPNTPATIWGDPVIEVEGAPAYSGEDAVSTSFISYGNFDYWIYGDRQQLSLFVSPHIYFVSDQTGFRWGWRGWLGAGVASAFAKLTTAAS